MTNDKLKRCKDLQSQIENKSNQLKIAKDNVCIKHYRGSDSYVHINISRTLLDMIQLMVVSSLEKELADLEKQYEAE